MEKEKKERKPRAKKAPLVVVEVVAQKVPVVSEQEQKIREFFDRLEVNEEPAIEYCYLLNKVFKLVVKERNIYEFDIKSLNYKKYLAASDKAGLIKEELVNCSGFEIPKEATIKNFFLSIDDSSKLEKSMAQQLFKPKSSVVESYEIYFKMKEGLKDNEVWVKLIEDGVLANIPEFFDSTEEINKINEEIEVICGGIQEELIKLTKV